MIIKIERKKRKKGKGAMARKLVYYCITVLSLTLIWAVVLKTTALFSEELTVDVSDVLTFAGATFGGELLLLAFKRVFAKSSETENEDNGTDEAAG